jgi:hypothetical protein
MLSLVSRCCVPMHLSSVMSITSSHMLFLRFGADYQCLYGAGGFKEDVKGHELVLNCDKYLPIDSKQVSTSMQHATLYGYKRLC